jgi:hypothetical protein
MITLQNAKDFKIAAKKLQNKVEQGLYDKEGKWECGICYMISSFSFHADAYTIMEALLEHGSLGTIDHFNENRRIFLEFLAYSITEEDIFEICEAYYKNEEEGYDGW